MSGLHLIRQHDEKDCGAACMSMIFDYHGKKLPMATVRESLQVDQYGANIFSLLDAAEKNGLTAHAFEDEAQKVWDAIQSGEVPMPAVIRIVNRGIYEHYVVVNGIRRGKLRVFDPDMGRRSMRQEEFQQCFLGQIMAFEKEPDFQKENRRKGRFSRFVSIVSRQKGLLCAIGLLSLFVTAIGLGGTFSFQYLIDNVLSNLHNEELLDEGLDTFALLITFLGGLYLVKLLVQLLRAKLLTVMSKNIDLPLMLGYYDHVTRLPQRFFDTRKTGEIMSRFNDAGKIRDAISGVTLTLMIDTVMVAVTAVVLYRASATLFTVAMITFLLYLLISGLYVKPLEKFNRELMEKNAQFSSYLKESIDGMETVRTSQAEGAVREKTGSMFRDFLKRNISGSLMGISKDSLIECVTSLSTLVLLWMGAVNIIRGEMTAGALITFVTLLDYFLSPVQNLVQLQTELQTALVAADRLNDVLDLEAERSSGQVPEDVLKSVQFDNVSFRYGARELTLDGVTFSVSAGERVALVGESGCGKSTTSKLMMGFYQPENGTVRVNGVSLAEVSLEWLRSQTACVPQNTFLFSDTVRNNLTLGLPRDRIPSDEEISRILDACRCEFVREMPLGVDSMLEENGMNLSGGQRQRLAIARALLRHPRLLILDEATSALDTVTEREVHQSLKELFPDMMIVTIAHRLSSVKECQQILVMERGKVVEYGNHAGLLRKQGLYANLWKGQRAAA